MKEKILSLLFLFVINLTFSQVGINTTDPKEALHVAGSNSTIRVEAVNKTNNSTKFITGEDNRLHVDKDGNFVLDDSAYTPNLLVDKSTTNFVSSEVRATSAAKATSNILTGTFNTNKAGLVKVIFSVSVTKIRKQNLPQPAKYWLIDGDAKLIGVNCYIDGNLVSQSAKIYMSKKVNSTGNTAVAEGTLTLEAKVFVNLPKKNGVTYKLEAVVDGETNGLRATFAEAGTLNSFQVITY